MLFEFAPEQDFNFLTSFAERFKVPVQGNKLTIPASLGEGNIRIFHLEPDYKLLIHRYKLKEDFFLKRNAVINPTDLVSIIFNRNEESVSSTTAGKNHFHISRNSAYAIQIASSDLESVIRFPANTNIYFTVIGIRATRLKEILRIKKPNSVVQTIVSGSADFLFHETMGTNVQKLLKQLTDAGEENQLSDFYHRIKIEELLYLVFEQLLKRETINHSPIHKAEIEKLYLIRTALLADLSRPPRLAELAQMAGLSETKMKGLFKQVFGESIFNYFQKARMDEAAFLLKHGGVSVSEAGYELGFTNLSHFGQVFEKHYGLNPKKYSSV